MKSTEQERNGKPISKLFGRSKVLPESTTIGDILWKDNNLMLDFRLRATPVTSYNKWRYEVLWSV